MVFSVLFVNEVSKIDKSKSESEGGASEVQHDQRKSPPSQGFYTKVRTGEAHPSTSPPSQPHSTALFSEVWQKIASQGLLLQGVWVKVGGWETERDRVGGWEVRQGDGDGDAVTFNDSVHYDTLLI